MMPQEISSLTDEDYVFVMAWMAVPHVRGTDSEHYERLLRISKEKDGREAEEGAR